jgi:hypothetical protein
MCCIALPDSFTAQLLINYLTFALQETTADEDINVHDVMQDNQNT